MDFIMKIVKHLFLIFTISSTSIFARDLSKEINYVHFSNKIVDQFCKEMESKHDLYCYGSGGSFPHDIESIDLSFFYKKKMSKDEARKLEIIAIQSLAEKINNNREVSPYLREHPFPPERMYISISFNNMDEKNLQDGELQTVMQARNKLFFHHKNSIHRLGYVSKEEPYEEAFNIVRKSYPELNIKKAPKTPPSPTKIEAKQPLVIYSPEKEMEMIEACGKAQTVTFSQALKELLPGVADHYFDESYFQTIAKLEKEQFNGEYEDYWENGQLRTRVTLVKGVPDGHFQGWYPNGSDAFKGYLEMGEKQGIHMSFFYQDQVTKARSSYGRILYYDESGQLHGKQQASTPRGRLKAFVQYVEGKKDGNYSLYKPEGGAYVMKVFKDGKETQVSQK